MKIFIILIFIAIFSSGCNEDFDFNKKITIKTTVRAKVYSAHASAHPGWIEFCKKYDHPINQPQKTITDLKKIFYELFDNFNYVSDQDNYAVSDQWEIIGSDGKGDCEDFALTLFQNLLSAGFEKPNVRIALGWVGDSYHCVCLVEVDSGVLYVCDNYGICLFDKYECEWDRALDETHLYWVKM